MPIIPAITLRALVQWLLMDSIGVFDAINIEETHVEITFSRRVRPARKDKGWFNGDYNFVSRVSHSHVKYGWSDNFTQANGSGMRLIHNADFNKLINYNRWHGRLLIYIKVSHNTYGGSYFCCPPIIQQLAIISKNILTIPLSLETKAP